MLHPGAARIDCEECQKFVFNIQTGEQDTYKSGPERTELPLARGPGQPPPCHQCPKESPERAKQIELNDKNWAAYAHYRQAKAVGLTEEERRDPIVRRNFAVIESLVNERDKQDSARHLAEALVAVLTKDR